MLRYFLYNIKETYLYVVALSFNEVRTWYQKRKNFGKIIAIQNNNKQSKRQFLLSLYFPFFFLRAILVLCGQNLYKTPKAKVNDIIYIVLSV